MRESRQITVKSCLTAKPISEPLFSAWGTLAGYSFKSRFIPTDILDNEPPHLGETSGDLCTDSGERRFLVLARFWLEKKPHT